MLTTYSFEATRLFVSGLTQLANELKLISSVSSPVLLICKLNLENCVPVTLRSLIKSVLVVNFGFATEILNFTVLVELTGSLDAISIEAIFSELLNAESDTIFISCVKDKPGATLKVVESFTKKDKSELIYLSTSKM